MMYYWLVVLHISNVQSANYGVRKYTSARLTIAERSGDRLRVRTESLISLPMAIPFLRYPLPKFDTELRTACTM